MTAATTTSTKAPGQDKPAARRPVEGQEPPMAEAYAVELVGQDTAA